MSFQTIFTSLSSAFIAQKRVIGLFLKTYLLLGNFSKHTGVISLKFRFNEYVFSRSLQKQPLVCFLKEEFHGNISHDIAMTIYLSKGLLPKFANIKRIQAN